VTTSPTSAPTATPVPISVAVDEAFAAAAASFAAAAAACTSGVKAIGDVALVARPVPAKACAGALSPFVDVTV
jgi:hypothetical protein